MVEFMLRNFGLSFHHYGLAVVDPNAARTFLSGMGYSLGNKVFDPLQQVDLIMCRHESMPAVELIFPAATGPSPIKSILRRRPEGIVYHLCYATRSLQESLHLIEAEGLRVLEVSPPKPAILFDGAPVSFYVIWGLGLIEVIEFR